jgi:hypothetical protein
MFRVSQFTISRVANALEQPIVALDCEASELVDMITGLNDHSGQILYSYP